MLVNKSGRRLVIGRINVKNGEVLPGIPFTAGERKSVERFIAKGYIVEENAEPEISKPELTKSEPSKPAKAKAKPEPVVEEPKPEPVVEEPKPEPAYVRYSRRRKKAAEQAQEAVAENDGVSNND